MKYLGDALRLLGFGNGLEAKVGGVIGVLFIAHEISLPWQNQAPF
jgi:hypothetical protein